MLPENSITITGSLGEEMHILNTKSMRMYGSSWTALNDDETDAKNAAIRNILLLPARDESFFVLCPSHLASQVTRRLDMLIVPPQWGLRGGPCPGIWMRTSFSGKDEEAGETDGSQ